MKKFFKSLIIIFLPLTLAYANNMHMPKITIIPEKLSIAEFYEKHTSIGQIKLTNSRDYFAKIGGKVDFISNTQGNKILKGDTIIVIDKAIAETSKSQAEANLHMAEANYNRDLSLFKKKIISEEILNQSKTSLEKAKNEYAKAINNYKDMVIKATDDGYIGVIKANIGDTVKEGDYLFSTITKSDFLTFIELPEILHNKVSINDIVNARGKKETLVPGKIVAISDYVSDKGTINVKISFPYSDDLIHGTFVENEIIFNKHKALGLPEKAVLKNNQGDFVYAITPENKVKQVFVTLGVRTNNMIELLSNELKEGDLIVLDGLTKVYDGADIVIGTSDIAPKS